MKNSRLRSRVLFPGALLFVAWVVALAVPASAQNYGNFVGTTVIYANVSESSGTDPGASFFKAPSIFGDTLDFNPTFTANAANGNVQIRDAQLNFDLLARPGFGVQGLLFSERGDFSLAGSGTANPSADISASFIIDILEVDNLVINPIPLTLTMLFSPNASGTFTLVGGGGPPVASGTWSGALSIDFAAALTAANISYSLGATRVSVALDNTLSAISEPNSQAFIAKKDAKGLSITVVPEPSTFALLGLGTAALLAIRRRR
jgi:hypothetical protein